jgi:hypothetical protein
MDTPEKGDKGEDAGGFERTEEKRLLIDLSGGLRLPAAGNHAAPRCPGGMVRKALDGFLSKRAAR